MEVKALLDTHTLIWWLLDDPNLSKKARAVISQTNNQIYVSSVSAWELSIKHHSGKLPKIGNIVDKLSQYIRNERFEILPILLEHALLAGKLPEEHKDHFDRMLVAQTRIENLKIVTTDPIFKKYHCEIIW